MNMPNELRQMNKTEEFVRKAREKHGDTYDYSKVEYVNKRNKVTIICKEHGEFTQLPYSHLSGCNCRKCSISGRKIGKSEFIQTAIETHGDVYNYDKVVYENCDEKVIIVCKHHGEFLQTPYHHNKGQGCNKCGTIRTSDSTRYNTATFVNLAKELHGDTYSYDKVEYVISHQKIIIICPTHGEFLQTPNGHLSGKGCNICGTERTTNISRSNTQEFIEKSKLEHGEEYDYSKVDYKSAVEMVIIICKLHGEFLQLPSVHLRGSGCMICGGCKLLTTSQFIERSSLIHGDVYDYSKTVYQSKEKKVVIICKEHGEFSQIAKNHMRGSGCNICGYCRGADKQRGNATDFSEKNKKIHNDTYNYSSVDYVTARTKVEIICKKHGSFYQTPDAHSKGVGCPMCKHKTEDKLFTFIHEMYTSLIFQFKKEWCMNETSKTNKYLPFDFCLPESKIIIELDGIQHFEKVKLWNTSPEEQRINDKFKEKCANDNHFSVIRILQEDVFHDKYDWRKELCDTIEEIKLSQTVTNRYLCKNGEYDSF